MYSTDTIQQAVYKALKELCMARSAFEHDVPGASTNSYDQREIAFQGLITELGTAANKNGENGTYLETILVQAMLRAEDEVKEHTWTQTLNSNGTIAYAIVDDQKGEQRGQN